MSTGRDYMLCREEARRRVVTGKPRDAPNGRADGNAVAVCVAALAIAI